MINTFTHGDIGEPWYKICLGKGGWLEVVPGMSASEGSIPLVAILTHSLGESIAHTIADFLGSQYVRLVTNISEFDGQNANGLIIQIEELRDSDERLMASRKASTQRFPINEGATVSLVYVIWQHVSGIQKCLILAKLEE